MVASDPDHECCQRNMIPNITIELGNFHYEAVGMWCFLGGSASHPDRWLLRSYFRTFKAHLKQGYPRDHKDMQNQNPKPSLFEGF